MWAFLLSLSVCFVLSLKPAFAGCVLDGEFPLNAPQTCNEDVKQFLKEVAHCNAAYRANDEAALEQWQCDTLHHVEETIVMTYEDDEETMSLITDYFKQHDLHMKFTEYGAK